MKINITSFLIVSLFLGLVRSYAATIDTMGKTTVCLRRVEQVYEMKGGKKQEVWYKNPENGLLEPKFNIVTGTGFLVDHNKKIYLVTAAHVAREMTQDSEIIWNTASRQNKIFKFSLIQKSIPGSKWFFHPSADIAVHPFGFSEETNHVLIPENAFAKNNDEVRLLTKVCIVGFPLGLGINEALSPVAKRTEVASWLTTIESPQISADLKFILLDDDLAQGYSGAPVFISPEPQMIDNTFSIGGVEANLLGIQSMTISDQTGGKISLVVPIAYLVEIFDSESFKEFEKITTQENDKKN